MDYPYILDVFQCIFGQGIRKKHQNEHTMPISLYIGGFHFQAKILMIKTKIENLNILSENERF